MGLLGERGKKSARERQEEGKKKKKACTFRKRGRSGSADNLLVTRGEEVETAAEKKGAWDHEQFFRDRNSVRRAAGWSRR